MPRRRQPEPPATGAPGSYDWLRHGRHRLRAPNATIIDLPVPVAASSQLWVGTIWPDAHTPGGWARQLWSLDSARRGWQLPYQLAAGDVVEVGADTTTATVRWYGIMDSYEVDRWATLQGPYPHPAAAYDEAQRLLAHDRYRDPLTSTEPPSLERPTSDGRARCRRRRHHLPRRRCGGSGPI